MTNVENQTESVWWTVVSHLDRYVDLDFSIWIWRLLHIVVLSFALPFMYVAFLYITSAFYYSYKMTKSLMNREVFTDEKFWSFPRKCVAYTWITFAIIYHGYEVIGMENLPIEGPALIIYYHGALPMDLYFLMAKIAIARDRLIYTVVDKFLAKFPGWAIIQEAMKSGPWTAEACVQVLNEGNLLAVSPGGIYEAQFGDNYYNLLWRKRIGFAKVAIEAKVPIIPMFTENLREGNRTLTFLRRFLLNLYNKIRMPVIPMVGVFPVKLRTYLGKPIPYDPNISPDELQKKVAVALEDLIKTNQRIPGNILYGLSDRFIRKAKNS